MKKFVLQSILCLAIAGIFFCAEQAENSSMTAAISRLSASLAREYTLSEIRGIREQAKETFQSAISIGSGLRETFESGVDFETGVPIDEKPLSEKAPVYAAAGGTVRVIESDDENIGNYLIIQHGKEAESVYGNLNHICVVKGEHVRKGQMIGSYDEKNEKEFYYSIESLRNN